VQTTSASRQRSVNRWACSEGQNEEEEDIRGRLVQCKGFLEDATRASCLQRLEQHLEAVAATEAIIPDEEADVQSNYVSKGAGLPRCIVPSGRGGNPGSRLSSNTYCRTGPKTSQKATAAANAGAETDPSESAPNNSDSTTTYAEFTDSASAERRTEQAEASSEAEVKPKLSPQSMGRAVCYNHAKDLEQASYREAFAMETMKKFSKPSKFSKCWKRLPKFCHFMREELCRSIFASFMETLHEELELPRNTNPLNGLEDKNVASIIKSKDVVALVKYLAETELHMRLGPRRSKVLPEAPLNMQVYASLRSERQDMAIDWGVRDQDLREERIFGLFLRGPFTWKSLRQLLWDANYLPPAPEENPGATEDEEEAHDEQSRSIAFYQEELRKRMHEAMLKMEQAMPESPQRGHASRQSALAPDGLIDALSGEGNLGLDAIRRLSIKTTRAYTAPGLCLPKSLRAG
jgi:hypothetical protein